MALASIEQEMFAQMESGRTSMEKLEGKVAFITGGGSGVGLGQAQVFAEEADMTVVIADIREDHLRSALDWFSQRKLPAHGIRLDITDRAAYARGPMKPRAGLDRLICCATPLASASLVRSSKPPMTTGTGRST